MNYVEKIIKQGERENVKFVFPVMQDSEIGKYISAFSNTTGGALIFGVSDDSVKMVVKGYRFLLNTEKIMKDISGVASIEAGFEIVEGEKLLFIKVKKCREIVYFQNKIYSFSMSGDVIELKKKKIFLSYNHNDSNIVDLLESELNTLYESRIELTRDVNILKYKDSLDEFMQTIKDHDFVISIVSDTYLKSTACMYEISELMRDRRYMDKLLFITINKNDLKNYENEDAEKILPKLYGLSRFEYVEYWQNQKLKVEEISKRIDAIELIAELSLESRLIRKISINVSEFIEELKDLIGQGFEDMKATGFDEVRKLIN